MNEFDVVVIGAGPGGYVCAIRAAQLGKKVAIVEANHLGGICLNWGCIPTKALLRSAEVFHLVKNSKKYGISSDNVVADMKDIVARSRNVASQLASGVSGLLKKNKVTIYKGFASFISNKKIKVTGQDNLEISAKNFVIATGARARNLKGFEADGKNILTYKEALILDNIPKKLAVIGSGAIGAEFASFYNSLGSEVVILEAQERILPAEDSEISAIARKAFEKSGIKIHTKITLKEVKSSGNKVNILFQEGDKNTNLEVEKVIMAVGVMPNTENIGLANTSIKLDEKNCIIVDGNMKTSEANIYAIGDVTKGPWLAHKASHEAIIAAESIAGHKTKPIDKTKIPACTYTMPQIASIGLTEEKAKEMGKKIKIGRFPFLANGKAIALGEQEGMIKMIFEEKTGEILGAHMVGAEVTELISAIAVAMTLEATEEEIMHTIFPHPTLSEMIHESSLNAYSKAIHI